MSDAYPGETLARLRRIEAAYDPDNAFNQNFPIPLTVVPGYGRLGR